jgi:hypothetical protein
MNKLDKAKSQTPRNADLNKPLVLNSRRRSWKQAAHDDHSWTAEFNPRNYQQPPSKKPVTLPKMPWDKP